MPDTDPDWEAGSALAESWGLAEPRQAHARAGRGVSDVRPINCADYERLAEERAEPGYWGYVVGGAGDEVTLQENRAAYGRVLLRPRMLVDVSAVSTATTVLGPRSPCRSWSPLPRSSASRTPMASPRWRGRLRPRGRSTRSSLGSVRPAELAEGVPEAKRWFQLYWSRDRDFTRDLVGRRPRTASARSCSPSTSRPPARASATCAAASASPTTFRCRTSRARSWGATTSTTRSARSWTRASRGVTSSGCAPSATSRSSSRGPHRRGRLARRRARRRRARRLEPRRPAARRRARDAGRPARGGRGRRRPRRGLPRRRHPARHGRRQGARTRRASSVHRPSGALGARGGRRRRRAHVLEILRDEIRLAQLLLGCPSPADVGPAHVRARA